MKLNIGIIGTGNIAQGGHGEGLRHSKSTRLWSVLSRDSKRAAEFSGKYGAQSSAPAHTELARFLADPELQAVIVTSPDKMHRDHAIACAEAGKHILLEKPMATDLPGARAIVAACEKAGVTLAIGYHLRWHPGHRKIVSLAHSGKLGELRHARVHWSWCAANAENWRAASELGKWWSLGGVGTHCLDIARWALCPSAGEVTKLQSVISREVWKGPHDETAVLALGFESGATAEICSSVLFDAPSRFELYGSKGFAICEGTFGRTATGTVRTNEGPIEYEQVNPFARQLDDFAEAIVQKRPPEVSGSEGARNVELLLEAVK